MMHERERKRIAELEERVQLIRRVHFKAADELQEALRGWRRALNECEDALSAALAEETGP